MPGGVDSWSCRSLRTLATCRSLWPQQAEWKLVCCETIDQYSLRDQISNFQTEMMVDTDVPCVSCKCTSIKCASANADTQFTRQPQDNPTIAMT